MTEDELALLRAQCAQVACMSLLRWVADLLAGAMPPREGNPTAQMLAIQKKLDDNLREVDLTTFPELHWAESDLRAAELQEAFRAAVKSFLDELAARGR